MGSWLRLDFGVSELQYHWDRFVALEITHTVIENTGPESLDNLPLFHIVSPVSSGISLWILCGCPDLQVAAVRSSLDLGQGLQYSYPWAIRKRGSSSQVPRKSALWTPAKVCRLHATLVYMLRLVYIFIRGPRPSFVAVSLMKNSRYLLPVKASPFTFDLHLCIILS